MYNELKIDNKVELSNKEKIILKTLETFADNYKTSIDDRERKDTDVTAYSFLIRSSPTYEAMENNLLSYDIMKGKN